MGPTGAASARAGSMSNIDEMGYWEPLLHLGRVMFGSELCGTLSREPGPALTSGLRLTSGR